jgi:two-component system chemotaxis response regulator CheB
MSDDKIKVLVVDDSPFMRELISDIINSTPDIEVVGRAANGKAALEKLQKLNPDLITLDIEMPVLDGLSTLSQLMRCHPLPVIMLSAYTTEGARATIRALELGAVDFIAKPSGEVSFDLEKIKDELLAKIRLAAGVEAIKIHPLERKKEKEVVSGKKEAGFFGIGIAASTGGPQALLNLLPVFPGDIPGAIFIVQHMPRGFTCQFAERLNAISKMTVKEAEDGEKVQPGCGYVAPGGHHLLVETEGDGKGVIRYSSAPPLWGMKPAADHMLTSIAKAFGREAIGVLLTGMGKDGASGLLAIKTGGGMTIAQNRESSLIFGMPKAAIELGAASHVLSIDEIGEVILKYLGYGVKKEVKSG